MIRLSVDYQGDEVENMWTSNKIHLFSLLRRTLKITLTWYGDEILRGYRSVT